MSQNTHDDENQVGDGGFGVSGEPRLTQEQPLPDVREKDVLSRVVLALAVLTGATTVTALWVTVQIPLDTIAPLPLTRGRLAGGDPMMGIWALAIAPVISLVLTAYTRFSPEWLALYRRKTLLAWLLIGFLVVALASGHAMVAYSFWQAGS